MDAVFFGYGSLFKQRYWHFMFFSWYGELFKS